MDIAEPTRRALVLVVAALVVSGSAPQPAQAVGRLPSCDLGDVYTVPRGYDDWSVTLVDRLLRVEKDYVPPDLVNVREAGLAGGGRIRGVAVEDTRAMARAARAAGAPIGVWSGYRSYAEQVQIFTGYARQNGQNSAITYSQRPGHSEHQLGLGVDFMSAGGGNPLPGDWATTAAGRWMRENSWKYGWVNSYPRGKGGTRWNDRTCLRYEPWHYRYLGREVAAEVHGSGLTIREYLWANHTQLDSTGAVQGPTPTSPATPSTSAEPSATTTARVTPRESPLPAAPSAEPTLASQPATGTQADVLPVVLGGGALRLLGVLALVGLARSRRRTR
jgi:D-alanyl-D-alanine carboxypeptidase